MFLIGTILMVVIQEILRRCEVIKSINTFFINNLDRKIPISNEIKTILSRFLDMKPAEEDFNAEKIMKGFESGLIRINGSVLESYIMERICFHLTSFHEPSKVTYTQYMLSESGHFRSVMHWVQARAEVDRCTKELNLPPDVKNVIEAFRNPHLVKHGDIKVAMDVLAQEDVPIEHRQWIFRIVNASSIINYPVYLAFSRHIKGYDNPSSLNWQDIWVYMNPNFSHDDLTKLNFQHMVFIKSESFSVFIP